MSLSSAALSRADARARPALGARGAVGRESAERLVRALDVRALGASGGGAQLVFVAADGGGGGGGAAAAAAPARAVARRFRARRRACALVRARDRRRRVRPADRGRRAATGRRLAVGDRLLLALDWAAEDEPVELARAHVDAVARGGALGGPSARARLPARAPARGGPHAARRVRAGPARGPAARRRGSILAASARATQGLLGERGARERVGASAAPARARGGERRGIARVARRVGRRGRRRRVARDAPVALLLVALVAVGVAARAETRPIQPIETRLGPTRDGWASSPARRAEGADTKDRGPRGRWCATSHGARAVR